MIRSHIGALIEALSDLSFVHNDIRNEIIAMERSANQLHAKAQNNEVDLTTAIYVAVKSREEVIALRRRLQEELKGFNRKISDLSQELRK